MAENEIIVTDAAQGVDCWMCEEDEPHTHGRILTSLRWYRVVAQVNGWAITLGFLVNAPTAKAANDKAQSHIDADPKLGRWAKVLAHRCRLADEKTKNRMLRDYPKSVIS